MGEMMEGFLQHWWISLNNTRTSSTARKRKVPICAKQCHDNDEQIKHPLHADAQPLAWGSAGDAVNQTESGLACTDTEAANRARKKIEQEINSSDIDAECGMMLDGRSNSAGDAMD
jgi:hypothetical protein